MPVQFITEVPSYEIVDGVMHVTSGEWCIAMSLRTFERGMARSAKVIREYRDAKAEIVQFERKVAGHAARP